MKRIIVFSVLFIIPVMLFAAFWSARTAASAPVDREITGVGAPWYDADWHYRRPVTVTNSSTALTNYQVLVRLDSSFDFTHARTDGSDLRVTASNGTTPLSFWVESWDNPGTKAWVWVKAPSLLTGNTTFYLYYGNDSAASASDGTATFEAYDGFENYIVGGAPWGNFINPGEWTRYPGNPVLEGTAGWDAAGATFASVISDTTVISGTTVSKYRMYYHGWGGAGCTGSCIGLATSLDGQTWSKYSGNPVMYPGSSGAWDVDGVRVPMVWKEGSTDYRMIYTGYDSTTYGFRVGYATSSDGITWYKSTSNPVFYDNTLSSWSYHSVENWGVIKVGSQYLMWYGDLNAPRESGIATSTDLISWTPYASNPIFATSGGTSSYTYSQYCPFTFVYGGYYYVLVPSYTSVGNYARYYLYRSSSPYFPTGDRYLVRVVHTTGASWLWDAQDSDTPMVLTSDIERSVFPGNQLWTYYAGASEPAGTWREGLLIEPNIAAALTDAALPFGVSWTTSPAGSVTVANSPLPRGAHSVWLNDIWGCTSGCTGCTTVSARGTFVNMNKGVVSAWMWRSVGDNTSCTNDDYDIYLYGDSAQPLLAVAGLGGNNGNYFHYWWWNGTANQFSNTGVSWSTNTWYLVKIIFNADTDRYDFLVYDTDFNQIVNVTNIPFGNRTYSHTYVNSAMLYTGGIFLGNAYADDYYVRKITFPEPAMAIRSYSDIQETQAIMGTLDFSRVGITVTVETTGSLTSLQVIRYNHFHPNSPAAQQPVVRRYWEIIPNGGASGYTASLTLPHPRVPDNGDTVCFYVSGTTWDCAADSVDNVAGTITRAGIPQFSEWTTQEDFSPLAITLQNFEASSKTRLFIPGLLAASLACALTAAVLLWSRRVRPYR